MLNLENVASNHTAAWGDAHSHHVEEQPKVGWDWGRSLGSWCDQGC